MREGLRREQRVTQDTKTDQTLKCDRVAKAARGKLCEAECQGRTGARNSERDGKGSVRLPTVQTPGTEMRA